MRATRAKPEMGAELPRALARALKAREKRYRRALERGQRKFSPKAVHDSRIETRRLLAALELLGAFLPASHLDKARRLLKRHLKSLAALRDTQVQRLRVARLLRRFPGLAEFDAVLARDERRGIKQARKGLRRVKPKKLRALVSRLAGEVRAQPAARVWRKSLAAMDRALAEVAARRRAIDPEVPATVHRTRVAFKHFRYMVESLHEALAPRPPRALRAMQAYQTLMGDIQDLEVLAARLEAFLRKEAVAPARSRPWLAELARQRRRLMARYLKRAEELASFRALIPPGPGLPRRGSAPL